MQDDLGDGSIPVWMNRLADGIVERDKRIAYLEKALRSVQHDLKMLKPNIDGVEIMLLTMVIDKALKGEESEKGEHAKSSPDV